MRLALISATLPPSLDGIGDYTAQLATELARRPGVGVTVWTGATPAPAPLPGVTVRPAFEAMQPRSADALCREIAADRPDWVVLQYNPFSFGKWGLNLHLPKALRRLRRTVPGTRLALMIHEPFVPVINAKFAVMATWQRAQLAILGRTADAVLVSIEPWVERFRSWFPGKPLLHLPVGSAIPVVPTDREAERARLGLRPEHLVVGIFGQAHPTRMLPEVVEAVRSLRAEGHDARLLYVGPHGTHLRALAGDLPLLTEGPLPPGEVSRCFAAMDLYMAPFLDGASTRRTSLMTGLQHGLPVLSTHGPLTDALLHRLAGSSLVLVDAGDGKELGVSARTLARSPARRQELGRSAAAAYQAHFGWPQIAERLMNVLEPTPVEPTPVEPTR